MEEMKNQDMIALLLAHRSVREFTTQPVTEETIDTIVACAQQAPTSSYLQAYTIIRVTDADKRAALAAYAGGQEQIVRVLSPFCQRDAPFQSNSTAATAEESSCRARRSSSAKPQLISMRPRCSTTPPPVSRVSAARVKPAPGFLPLAASTTA